MTSDETKAAAVDQGLLEQVMACDALLLAASTSPERGSSSSSPATEADDRGRSRLLLLLTMLDAAESSPGRPRDARPQSGWEGRDDSRPLLGRFEVLGDLGSGGFGFVVRARDLVLGREVALKMPLPERVLAPGDMHRFLREARAAARLDHPNIVRIFDAGELGPLGYFIASEYCAGPSLRRWLKAQNEPVPSRLAAQWLAALAGAVQHAHDRGILHRDIKPDNVILEVSRGPDQAVPTGDQREPAATLELGGTASTVRPDEFVPRLTDFGLAKLVEETADETRSDVRMGTPHYMAPEQAAGKRNEVGPATDVYALGATLYEVLTGRPPFRGETDAETLRLVLDTEPVPLQSLRPALPRDLETICLKCLRKEPTRRYASADAVRDDLERFMGGRPILGRPITALERARGWARRRPAVAALLGLVVMLAGGLVVGTLWWSAQLRWKNRQLERAYSGADRHRREAEKQTRIAEERRRQTERHHVAESLRRAGQALDVRQIELAQDILHEFQPGPDGTEPRGFAWRYLRRQANREFSQLCGHEATVLDSTFSSDGKLLATRDLRGKVVVWDLAPGPKFDNPRAISSLADAERDTLWFSSDGRLIATLDQAPSGAAVSLFESASGRRVGRLDCGTVGWFGGACFDINSQRLAVLLGRPDGVRSVRWWNLSGGIADPHTWLIENEITFCAMPVNVSFVAATRGGRTRLLDPWTGERRVEFAESNLSPSALQGLSSFSADGHVFAAHTSANCVVLWDTRSGRELNRCEVQGGAARIALSSKGSLMAVLSGSGRLTVFDRSSNRLQVLTSGSGRLVKYHSLSFSSDETLLAIGQWTGPGGPQPAEVWEIATARKLAVFPGRNLGADVAFVPGRRSVIVLGGTRPRIWRLDPAGRPDALDGHTAEAWAAACSPDGRVLATGSDDTNECRTIKLWDPGSGKLLAGWKGHTATVATLAFSPDGRVLASGSLDCGQPANPNLMLWDAASHQRLATLEGHTGSIRSVAFSPDGRWLASASDDMTARLWDVAEQKTRFVLTGHTRNVNSVAFNPGGTLLATASNDATVRLWDVATGQARTILSDVGNTLAVSFSADGSLLAAVNEEGAIKLWDPATGELVRTIRGEVDQLRCLAFTPDGHNVAAAGKGKVIRIWDVATGQELLSLEGHQTQINALVFSRDGSVLASCDHQGKVRLWRADWTEGL